MGSITVVTYAMVSALKAAERIMGPSLKWESINDEQLKFLSEFFSVCYEEVDEIPEIKSIASWRVKEINTFLRKCGFSIQLKPIVPPSFYTASVLNLLVEWSEEGRDAPIRTEDKKEYPGVYIKEHNVWFYWTVNHPNPVACLNTKSKDLVYMTIWDRSPVPTGFNLVRQAEIFSSTREFCYEFNDLHFPMVDLDQKVNLSWFKGLSTIGQDDVPGKIAQAFQQTKLRMNEIGARVESGLAFGLLGAARHTDKTIHTIDKPFLIWFERKGLKKPLFVAYIDRVDWRRPAKL